MKNLEMLHKILAYILYLYTLLVYYTNKRLPGSFNPVLIHEKYEPFIITFWHGRHFMGPFLRPKDRRIVAMFSKSKDAEVNAILGQQMGLEVVRGSGGRGALESRGKGGARALLSLAKFLRQGINVSMIANISHSKHREVGRGLVILAKISGRPIIPYIYAFSREKIFEKSWDKAALPLPFGKSIFLAGEPFYVAKDSDEDKLDIKRAELTKIMDDLTEQAYASLGTKTII